MGAFTSCVRGGAPQREGSAMVFPTARSSPERWQLPAEVIDVIIEHPFHEVVDGDEFLKTGLARPMGYGEQLNNKKVYFLVPTNSEGLVREEPGLASQIKGLKKLMGRGGKKRVLSVDGSTIDSTEGQLGLGFAAL